LSCDTHSVMIYFFKGCRGGCTGCCKACDEICSGFFECCGAICDPICKTFDRPLGFYVLLCFILQLPVLLTAGASLADKTVTDCSDAPLAVFCAVDCLLAIGHFCFSIYLQLRLTKGLNQVAQQGMAAKELMNQAGHILCYDIGFCIYIFVFIFSFGLNCVGLAWASTCSPDTGMPYIAGGLMILWAFLAVNFALLWTCALACDDCTQGFFGSSQSKNKNTKNTGVRRMVLGKLVGRQEQQSPLPQQYGYPHATQQQPMYTQQPVFTQQPVQGYAQPVQGFAQPVAATGGQRPPPQQQPSMAKQAMQGLGRFIKGK